MRIHNETGNANDEEGKGKGWPFGQPGHLAGGPMGQLQANETERQTITSLRLVASANFGATKPAVEVW
jgi:hypothetical protein